MKSRILKHQVAIAIIQARGRDIVAIAAFEHFLVQETNHG